MFQHYSEYVYDVEQDVSELWWFQDIWKGGPQTCGLYSIQSRVYQARIKGLGYCCQWSDNCSIHDVLAQSPLLAILGFDASMLDSMISNLQEGVSSDHRGSFLIRGFQVCCSSCPVSCWSCVFEVEAQDRAARKGLSHAQLKQEATSPCWVSTDDTLAARWVGMACSFWLASGTPASLSLL